MATKRFYLIRRKDRFTDNKPTFYARFYDEGGELLPWRSTGETSKTRAELWALSQLKKGRLATRDNLTFSAYSVHWWKWGECAYIRGKLARGKSLSQRYADIKRGFLENHVLPYFGPKKLSKITPAMIEEWLLDLRDSSGLSPTTVNHSLKTLKTMLAEATRLGTIASNPAASVEGLAESPKERGTLTVAELRALFADEALPTVWSGDLAHFTLNLLAASTGLRMGEVQGLQVQHVHPGYIAVVHSWAREYGLTDPKWHNVREVPLTVRVSDYLGSVVEVSAYQEPGAFVFAGPNGKPIEQKAILRNLHAALAEIEISDEERTARNLTFHSHRHTFNSLCRGRIPDYKLQKLTGHRSDAMTEAYTHVRLSDFGDVVALQEATFG